VAAGNNTGPALQTALELDVDLVPLLTPRIDVCRADKKAIALRAAGPANLVPDDDVAVLVQLEDVPPQLGINVHVSLP